MNSSALDPYGVRLTIRAQQPRLGATWLGFPQKEVFAADVALGMTQIKWIDNHNVEVSCTGCEKYGLATRVGEKAEEAPDLAWRAVQGLAGEKHAKVVSDYARAENEKIDLALKRRVLDDKVRQEKATADKLEAEAALAKINELKARAELSSDSQRIEYGDYGQS